MNHAEPMANMPALADLDVSHLSHDKRPIRTTPPKRERKGYTPSHGATLADHLGMSEALRIASEAKKLVRQVENVLNRRDAYREVAIERMRSTYDECPTLQRMARRG